MKRMQGTNWMMAALLLAALLACKKSEKSESTGTTTESIGVAECDEYLNKYDKCVSSKVPESARPQLKQSVDTMRNAWKTAATTPAGKAGLAQGCKQALETAKASMGAYGCEW